MNKFYGRPWEIGCENPYAFEFLEIAKKYSIDIVLVNKANNKKNKKIELRKKAYKKLPYYLYLMIEKILYIKSESYDILLKVRKSAQKREEENEWYKNVNFQAAVQ